MIFVYKNIWRGPQPESSGDFGDLQAKGIKRIINLEYFDRDEDLNPTSYGMSEVSLPCSDFIPPEDWVVNKALELMVDGTPTYVHCYSGVDRTGFVCAAYRMQVMHWPYSVALQEWKNLGRHFWYSWWSYKLKQWQS